MDPAKIAIIVNLPPPASTKELCAVLGHIGYYTKFIHGYASITTPLEKLLKKAVQYIWIEDCQKDFNTLKELALRKICNVDRDDWDEHVPLVL